MNYEDIMQLAEMEGVHEKIISDFTSFSGILEHTPKHYFLIRVSNRNDSTVKQEKIAQKTVYDEVIFDYGSGSDDKLTKNLSDLMVRLQPGDSVTVSDISRLTRNTLLFLAILVLAEKRGVNFIFYLEGIDTNKMTAYQKKNLICSMAEAEFAASKSSNDMLAFYDRKNEKNEENEDTQAD